MKKNSVLETFKEPKWRHGALGALLTAGFLTICVLVNVGVSALEEEYGWRRDFSFNRYATMGETTKSVLASLTREVEIYLLYQNGEKDVQALQVLNRYRTMSDRVSVLETDIAKNPGVLTRFSGNLNAALTADSVVVYCPETGRYRVLTNENDFYTAGYNVETGAFEVQGLAYEKAVTQAIAYVARDDVPAVGLLQGHGELTPEALATMTGFLGDNGYDIATVNLLSGDALDEVDMLLIAGPQNDLTDAELAAIGAFAQNGGSLFVIRDYTDPIAAMPNYLALLRGYGVVPLPGVAVERDAQYYYGEPLYLLPYLCELDLTLQLTMGGYDVLLMPAACAFETPSQGDSGLSVATVLKTSPQAYLRSLTDGKDTIDKQEGDREGELTLALYAHRMHANGNVSRLFAIGNSALLTDQYIYERSYSEQLIMALMNGLLPQTANAPDIAPSSAFRPALTAGSQTLGVALLAALPLTMIVIALCVLLPRRNR